MVDEPAIRAIAKREGVDPEALLGAVRKQVPAESGADNHKPGDGQARSEAKLYMYLLPFVTVREVRQVFLQLPDSFPGDTSVASDWATKHPMGGAADPATTP